MLKNLYKDLNFINDEHTKINIILVFSNIRKATYTFLSSKCVLLIFSFMICLILNSGRCNSKLYKNTLNTRYIPQTKQERTISKNTILQNKNFRSKFEKVFNYYP